MQVGLDAYLGIHQDALKVQSKRLEVLADNLANADTPDYKARDIDFRAALAQASEARNAVQGPLAGSGTGNTPGAANIGSSGLVTTDKGHIQGDLLASGGADDVLKYRVPLAPALDGNTVDAQQEQAAFAESSVHYQATLTFLSMRMKSLMTAITGQ